MSTETFRSGLTSGRFPYGAELVSTRGIPAPGERSKLLDLGSALLADPRIGWVSITDNPGGNPMLPPDWIAGMLAQYRDQVVIHLTCKDLNRNGLESAAWRYALEGFHHILALSGDYPVTGHGGVARPVFDIDSVSLIALLQSMNDGLEVRDHKGQLTRFPKTDFYIGCAVSPFKRHERELMPQYFKLAKKIQSGSQWVIPQLGYDMRKFHEIQLFLRRAGLSVPVIGTVYLLNRTVANIFHRGEIPGCVVTDDLLALAEKYGAGPDHGRAFFLELAAKQLAVFRGLGFAAGHLAGTSKPELFFKIIELAESFGANDWRQFAREIQFHQPGEFYLFEQDPQTGLGNPDRLNPEYVRSLEQPPATRQVTFGYRFSRFLHDRLFVPGTTGYRLLQRLYRHWDTNPSGLAHAAHELEKLSKFIGYGCRDCGDCSLPDIANLCPLSSCAKDMRNGPCGGTRDGRCEVRELNKECIWARAYERMKFYRESETMLNRPPVFYNAKLKNTSAWANTFLNRDHHARAEDAGNTGKNVTTAR